MIINRHYEEMQGDSATGGVPDHRKVSIPVLGDQPMVNDLDKIRALLGNEAILVPVKRGTKIPMRKGWQDMTLEETRNPEYLRDLRQNNVAVLLGQPSGNLVGIDFDNETFMEEFIGKNHDLCARTFRSKGSRGCLFLFRMKGDYPPRVEVIKDADGEHAGEFRGGQGSCIIAGDHPSGVSYQILNKVEPLDIEFSQIQWPDGYDYPWQVTVDQEIAQHVGPPYDVNRQGRPSIINLAFFAEWVKTNLHIVFDETEEELFLYNPATGLWSAISDRRMAETAWKVSAEWLDQQDPGIVDALKIKFTQSARMDLVAMLKSKAVVANFFGTGEYLSRKSEYFHTMEGMMRCLPQGGLNKVSYLCQPFDPKFRSRQRFECRYLEDPQCPMFDDLMVSMFGAENVPFALKALGYLLVEGNPAQRILVIRGPARSGKSQLAIVLHGIMPEGSCGQLRTAHLDGRFEIGAFARKRLVYGPDVRRDFLCVDGARNLKALTGGDSMEAELKGVNERVPFKGDKHVLVTTNDVLRLAPGEDASAWRRRLIVMETKPADTNKIVTNLGQKILEHERDAVFTKLMNAGYRASVEMDETGMLEVPDMYQLGTSNAIILLGDVAQWVHECVEQGDDSYSTRALFTMYERWCAVRGETPESLSKFEKRLKPLMEDLGREPSHNIFWDGTSRNGYRGLEVRA